VRRSSALAIVIAACTADAGPTTGLAETSGSTTSPMVSDSIATAWETTDTDAATSSSTSSTTDAPGTEVTGIADTSSSSAADESSSSGEAPQPANLLENPSLEEWTGADEPNTTPDAWENCSFPSFGAGVDAVPDSCMGAPAVQVGLRYARAFSGEGIEQTIETVPGTTYRIAFDFTAVEECFGGDSNARWEVLVDEDQILTTPNAPDAAWESTEVTFAATDQTTTICFRKFGNGQGGIDNLSVVESP
jgi:hypothetical protein